MHETLIHEMNFESLAYNSERIRTLSYRVFFSLLKCTNKKVRRALLRKLKVYATIEEKNNWLKSYHAIFNNQ